MTTCLRKFEGFLMKEFRSKSALMVTLFVFYMTIPIFFVNSILILALIVALLPRDVKHGDLGFLLSLPYTRSEVFWFSYAFLALTLTFLSSVVGSIFFPGDFPRYLLRSLVFATGYYGLIVIFVMLGLDRMIAAFATFALDVFLGFVGHDSVYLEISPFYQRSGELSALVAVVILFISWRIFVSRGEGS